jgi:purine-nucleoside phosphorylase
MPSDPPLSTTDRDEAPVCLPPEALEAAETIRAHWNGRPRAGLILGTGQGALTQHLDPEAEIPYGAIPYFPRSTALGHRGQLVCGRLCGVSLVVMDGRCHVYEGYTLDQLRLPVWTLRALDVQWLIVCNAAGGLNPRFARGDVMIIDDHVSFFFGKRLCALVTPGRGLRSRPVAIYDRELADRALAIAHREDFAAYRGVYAAMTGPNYETRAEYRFLRRIGADAVGMSTVPETLAAAQCGLRTLGLSVITNVARPDHPAAVHAEDVVAAAQGAAPKVWQIVLGITEQLR